MYLMKEKKKPTERFRGGLQSQKSCCEHYFSKSQEGLRETTANILKKKIRGSDHPSCVHQDMGWPFSL